MNRFDVGDHMRLALTNARPRISNLAAQMQYQLLVFVRYMNSGNIKEEFLFCSALETTTKADDVMENNQLFSKMKILNGKTCVGFVQMGHHLCCNRNQDISRV